MLILRWILQFDLAEHVKIIPIMNARGAGRGLRAGVGITRGAGKFALRHAGRAAIAAAAIAAATAVITRGTVAVAAVNVFSSFSVSLLYSIFMIFSHHSDLLCISCLYHFFLNNLCLNALTFAP